MSQMTVRIGRDQYKTELKTRNHKFLADEPEDLKGTNQGPTPYEYLMAALGSCVVITVRMYADRKGWPVDAIQVELEQERIHAKDCEKCGSEEGYVHLIRKKLSFEGDLTDTQIERLKQISEKCPVHKTLTHEIIIEAVD